MINSGNIQNLVAQEEHGYANGTPGKQSILLDKSGNQANPSTEETLQALNASLITLIDTLGLLTTPFLAPYAKDASDQLRVVLAGGSTSSAATYLWSSGTYANFYATGGPNSVDGREQLQEINNLQFQQGTVSRWTF